MNKENNFRTENERREYEEGRKNPHGFRKGLFGTAEELAAYDAGQKAGRAEEEGKNERNIDDPDKDDLEEKR